MNRVWIVFAIVVLVLVKAQADRFNPEIARLKILARASTGSMQSKVVYESGSRVATVPDDVKSLLETIAVKQSQIWADTILENDYRLGSPTELDRVEVLYSNVDSSPLAYRITYSARAWYTADCPAHRSVATCEEGRIRESSFVSTSFSSWLTDESAVAVFVN